jgi:hypothetical protein
VSEPLVPEDVPIKPGEKHIFKISEADARSWDILRKKESRAELKHLKVLFQNINFGDGTGFTTTSGKPVNIHRKVNRAGPSLRMESCFANYLVAENDLPAILPVKFYGEETIAADISLL